jgi:hypothetical protein
MEGRIAVMQMNGSYRKHYANGKGKKRTQYEKWNV